MIFVLLLVTPVLSHSQRSIDLTWPFDDKTISWAGAQQFQFTKVTAEYLPSGDWLAANEFTVAEHAGTHIDAPYHFDKNGWKVAEIPLGHLSGPGIKIDLSNEAEKLDHETRLLPKHLIEWEERNGPIPQNSIILVSFNWARHYHNRTKYLGGDVVSDYKFPSISPEAAQWIVDTGKVYGLGLDTASVHLGNSTEVHNILLKNKIYIIENVKISHMLPEKGFWLVVMPMNIAEGTGAPTRIVAYPNKPHDFTS